MAGPQSPTSPRHGRRISFGGRSDKTHKSNNSANKIDLTETHEEKARRNLTTKADPTVAMYELQPNLVALEKSNLGSLRSMQHKDQYGNIITDPDRSNPTRPRFERPLDTIRSFESAIRGTYGMSNTNSRPTSYIRDEPMHPNGYNRRDRDSYYGQNGQYNGRGSQSRPDSYIDNYMGSGEGPAYYQNNGWSARPQVQRMNTDQSYGNGSSSRNPYPSQHTTQRSYDTTTASVPNTESWGNHSTNPSSIGGSMDQGQPGQAYGGVDKYGWDRRNTGNGSSNAPGGPSGAGTINAGGPVGGASVAAAPNNGHMRTNTNATNESQPQKKKGWFKKRFSRRKD